MQSRSQALRAVKVGDVIFGIAEGGQPKLLLVYEADESGFWVRHVTSQTTARFGRDGQSRWTPDGGSGTIVSTAALPTRMREVAIGLDRKMGTGKEYPDFVLSEAEIELLRTYKNFFTLHPLPSE